MVELKCFFIKTGVNMITYKNFIGHFELDDSTGIFCGEVINTCDVITFQGQNVDDLNKAFVDSIEDYLDFCSMSNTNIMGADL
jgi:predicted HicB family RNase H-like nuclease